ncbi:MAG: ABC transporter permease [Actinomycetes bacterium]
MDRIGRIALWVVAAAVLAFLLAPAILVLPMSLNSSPFLVFPPPGYTFSWFGQFFASPEWMAALQRSGEVALGVVLLSVLLGLTAAYALTRSRRQRFMPLVEPLVTLPMIVPSLIFAVGVYIVAIRLHLLGGLWIVVLGQAVLAIPFVLLNLRAALQTIDPRLEEAAWTLGSKRIASFVRITLPLMVPALIASAVLAAVLSLDETVFALFMTPDTAPTLPVLMYRNIQYNLNPLVPVAAAVMVFATGLVGGVGGFAYWLARRRLGSGRGSASMLNQDLISQSTADEVASDGEVAGV